LLRGAIDVLDQILYVVEGVFVKELGELLSTLTAALLVAIARILALLLLLFSGGSGFLEFGSS
jgi:hypothetical protein